MPLGVGEQAPSRLLEGAVLADAGEHVLQGPARGRVRVHVVGRHQGRMTLRGQRGEAGDARGIVAAVEVVGGKVDARRRPSKGGERGGEGGIARGRQYDEDLPFGVRQHVVSAQVTLPLGRAAHAQRQQPREPAIGVAVGGKAKQARMIAKLEPRPPPPAGYRPAWRPRAPAPRRRACCGRPPRWRRAPARPRSRSARRDARPRAGS